MKLTRRKLLAVGGGLGVTALYGAVKWRWGDPADVIVSILKRRVGFLSVDRESFHTFAKSYLAFRQEYLKQLQHLSAFSVPLGYFSPYGWVKQGHAFRRLEDNVVSEYLLSTDFFHHGADERRPIQYVTFYDPMRAPCRNPFARQV